MKTLSQQYIAPVLTSYELENENFIAASATGVSGVINSQKTGDDLFASPSAPAQFGSRSIANGDDGAQY